MAPEVQPAARGRSRPALLLGAVVLLALVLRLPTAGAQSFWLDEVYTGRIVDGSLGHAWSTIQRTENTPPLFYLLDWGWGRLFGTGELALRSLSAVAGALAVVPVVALTRLVGRDGPVGGDRLRWSAGSAAGRLTGLLARAGAAAGGPRAAPGPVPLGVALGAGVLLAVNPMAQWFSQEARSYGLFVLLSAVAWVALLRAAEEPTPRRLWAWALAAVAVSWTHYFGGLLFVVGWAAIAIVLLARRGTGSWVAALRRGAAPAAVSAVCVGALLPIAKNQQSTDMYQAISLVKSLAARIVETPKQFALGYNAPAEIVLGAVLIVVLAVLVLAGAWPRDGRPTRGTALLGLVAAIWLLPILGLVVGFDVVLTRNFVLLLPPLVVLTALGAWRLGRRGVLVLGAVGVVQLATIVVVALTPIYQRDDWRGALRAAESGQPAPQLLLIGRYQAPAATYYSPTLATAPDAAPVAVRSIALIDRLAEGQRLPDITPPAPPAGFVLAKYERRDQWRVVVWRAAAPVAVVPAAVQALAPQLPRSFLLRP